MEKRVNLTLKFLDNNQDVSNVSVAMSKAILEVEQLNAVFPKTTFAPTSISTKTQGALSIGELVFHINLDQELLYDDIAKKIIDILESIKKTYALQEIAIGD